jgi:hypothetical protein
MLDKVCANLIRDVLMEFKTLKYQNLPLLGELMPLLLSLTPHTFGKIPQQITVSKYR